MRRGTLLLLLLMGLWGPAQPAQPDRPDERLRKRIQGLLPIQRFPLLLAYGELPNQQSRFAEARSLLQDALKTAQQARLTLWEANVLTRLGQLDEAEGRYLGAIQYYHQALQRFQTLHLYDRQQGIYFLLSTVYGTLNDESRKHYYAQEFGRLNRRYNPLSTRVNSFLLHIYLQERKRPDQQDSLLATMRKVLLVCQVNRKWDDYYSILHGYGTYLSEFGRYPQAEAVFRRCLAFGRQQGDRRRELYAYLSLPIPLMHQQRLKEAEFYARLALSRIANDAERTEQHRQVIYGTLAELARARGDYQKALTYEQQHHQASVRVLNSEKSRQIAELEARYQTAQNQARIDALDQDNRRQLTQISWQAGALLALLVLLLFSLWQYRTIRRVNSQLTHTNQTVSQNNKLIQQQADHLAVLMRELHHRVKNNLAMVSSLLRMQSRRLGDPQAIQAVQDGQRRVEAISLIHQQIYQTDNLMDVPIKSYITELTEGLLVGYGFTPDTLDYSIEVADIVLDVEVAVPLGLILNEVLTNAFKYAYANEPHPYLKVLLRVDADPSADRLLIEVQDNGPGLDSSGLEGPGLEGPGLDSPGLDSRDSLPKRNPRSFGLRLIQELTDQLGGQMSFTNQGGTYFRLQIPRSTKPVRSLS